MSTLKNVANKLFKVELSSIKEVKEAINELKNIEQDATKVVDAYERKLSEAAAAYDVVMQERNAIYSWVMTSAPAIISDFESKAKDLGLDINDNPDVVQLKKLIEQGKEVYKVLDNDYLKNSPRKLL
jgi:hypothetical protein